VIPKDFITDWRATAPWVLDVQVEQDLIISRALVEIFRVEGIAGRLAFRGGTALYKLHLLPPARYSEDIDLVQVRPEPIGPTLDQLRGVLDPWLGAPARTLKQGRVSLVYRMRSEGPSALPMRLKVEINSEEHFAVHGYVPRPFRVRSPWFSGSATLHTYRLEELLGTKMRALYQRKKGRDLFDLAHALAVASVDSAAVLGTFQRYMEHEGKRVTRAQFESNLAAKAANPLFANEVKPLLAPGLIWDAAAAVSLVQEKLISRLPGDPWKGRAATKRS
jgi:predicted nucleotidyltransferase component of viral defense system